MAEKLVLISAIEELSKGDLFEDQDWPLHVTVMPWFSIPKQYEPDFVDALASRMHSVSPIVVIGDQNEYFGDKEKGERIKVRTLRNIGKLAYDIHPSVLDIINRFGGEVDSPYIRDLYRPHVTYQHGVAIDEGEEVTLERLQFIRGDERGPRLVENVFTFTKDSVE